jgi:Carboxypeptidase regulatory-like domain
MSVTQKSAVLLLLSLFFASLAFAQGGATGAISGVVQDQSGAVVAGAKVSVKSEATGEVLRQITTDSSGLFTATLLPVGDYTVEVNAAGFPVTRFPGVPVRITETTRITAAIKLSTVKEVVEVQAEAQQVDTTDATTGESISSTSLSSLPLATRNFQQLLDLSAGASASLNNAAALGRGDVRIDVNGGREDNNNYLIEGVSASDYSFGELTYTPVPNPDSIQEFKVGTSLYDATQGRNGGGNINAILKSGTSGFHGDLWEYFRNTKLDAEDFFVGKFDLKQNIFGGDLGGPVGDKGKFGYFYVNYQGARQRSGDSLGTYISGAPLTALPTARDCTTLVNTFFPSGLPSYATNTGVDCGLDPVAFNLLNTKGTQFGPGTGGGWLIPSIAPGSTLTISTPGRYRDDQFTANWDKDFNGGKDRISERFFWSDSETYQPFGADNLQVQTGYPAAATNLNFPLDIPLRGRFGSVAETHTFSNSLVNEFRFGINVIGDSLENVSPPGTSPGTLGINNGYGQPDMYRLQFLGSGYQAGPFPNQLQSSLSDSFVYLDTVSWTKGRHSFRFGGEIDRTSVRRNLPVLDNPLLLFIPGTDPAGLGDFQDFLLGQPFVAEGGSGDSKHDYHIPAFGAFAQDDYRIRPDLTLNLGLRTEWVGAASDNLCHLGNTIPQNANTSGFPFVYPKCANKYGIPGLTGTLNDAALNNEYSTVIEPRIGFAYDVGGGHKTVVRGGYGIYSVREDIGAVDNLSFSPPFYPVSILIGVTPYESLTSMYSGVLPPLGAPPSATFLPTPPLLRASRGALRPEVQYSPAPPSTTSVLPFPCTGLCPPRSSGTFRCNASWEEIGWSNWDTWAPRVRTSARPMILPRRT